MTYTKRQFFIHRLEQSINLLNKVCKYMIDVEVYVDKSKFAKKIHKIHKQLNISLFNLEKFLEMANPKGVEYLLDI